MVPCGSARAANANNGADVDALNATTGALVSGSAATTSTVAPEAVDGNALIVTNDRYVTAFAARTGTQLWQIDSGSTSTDY